jgi:hypothetical protein
MILLGNIQRFRLGESGNSVETPPVEGEGSGVPAGDSSSYMNNGMIETVELAGLGYLVIWYLYEYKYT